MKYKYFAYDNEENYFDLFETEEEAKEFVITPIKRTRTEELYPEGYINGGLGWGKIMECTKFIEEDSKENYEDQDDWPYNSDWDFVGDLILTDPEE